MHFNSAEEKQAFTVWLADIRKRLTPITCSSPLDNLALLEAMFAKVDGMVSSVGSFPRSERGSSQSFLRSSGTMAFNICMFQQLLFKTIVCRCV